MPRKKKIRIEISKARGKRHAKEDIVPTGERICPICGSRESLKIDVCDDHGVWLDTGELETIVNTLELRGRAVRFDG